MQDIQWKIKEKLLAMGVSDVGFCNVNDGVSGLNNGISLVVKLSGAILEEIIDKPTHTYFNHYRTVNAFIDQCLLQTGIFLETNGYSYITVAASQSINDEGWNYRGRYSHKKIATLSGLGNIGNSSLFLHKDFGAKVRLGTVFTDCEFQNPTHMPISFCSHCNICKDICPSKAILGNNWEEGIAREEIFRADLCSEYMKKEFKNIGRGSVCGICVQHCPKG